MSTEDTPVAHLKNIGPKTAALLEEIGIYTKKNLTDMGPVMAFKILQHRFQGISLIALYAMYGAIHDVHWNSISKDVKKQLRDQAKEALDIDLR